MHMAYGDKERAFETMHMLLGEDPAVDVNPTCVSRSACVILTHVGGGWRICSFCTRQHIASATSLCASRR